MKKIFLATILIAGPQLLMAENGLTNPGMQQLMMKMQEIQSCMANIDQAALEKLAEQAEQVQQKIEQQCDKGDVKGAEKSAMDFVNQLKASPEVEQVQACAKDLPDMMQGHIQMLDVEGMRKQYEKKDICSAIKN